MTSGRAPTKAESQEAILLNRQMAMQVKSARRRWTIVDRRDARESMKTPCCDKPAEKLRDGLYYCPKRDGGCGQDLFCSHFGLFPMNPLPTRELELRTVDMDGKVVLY